MLKGVIFDLDNTIAHTHDLCVAAFRKAITELSGSAPSDKQIADTFGPSEEGTIMALIPEYLEEGVALYLRYYEELHGMCPAPYEGIPELLGLIKDRGAKLALVTGKGPKSLAISLAQFGLENCFEAIETGNPHGPSKPEGLRRVLGALELQPEEAVYVGDAPTDITAAKQVGIPVISAAWGGGTKLEELEKRSPARICNHVCELRDYLLTSLPEG